MQAPCAKFSNDFVFLQAIIDDNREAIECIYTKMYQICIPYALSRSSKRFTKDDALDILHDAFIVVLTKLKSNSYILSSVPITQFARIVFRNLWVSFVKRNKGSDDPTNISAEKKEEGEEDHESESGEEPKSLENTEETDLWDFLDDDKAVRDDMQWQIKVDCLESARARVPENCRKLIQWFYIDDVSLAECGERLGITGGSAKVKRHRCFEDFKIYYLACINQ